VLSITLIAIGVGLGFLGQNHQGNSRYAHTKGFQSLDLPP
jgi:hypothetical protein